VALACLWGRRSVAQLSRYLEAEHHRTRFNHVFLVERWAPAAALRQQARERLQALPLQPGDTGSLLRDASQPAQRGMAMDASATRKAPVLDASLWGHQYVCALLLYRDHVLPCGLRLYVTRAPGARVGVPCRQTTALAAELIRACKAPAGVTVRVLCAAYDLCHTVVKAGREQGVHCAAPLKRHRRLFTPGWKLQAGRYGKPLFRRRRPAPLMLEKPHGQVRSRDVDAGWLQVRTRGVRPVVCARTGAARKILGLVTDAPEVSAAGLIRVYDRRWAIAPWLNDATPLWGLGQYQKRSYGAAVTHRHLGCVAYALLTHLRLERHGAPGQRRHDKAADRSTAAAQDQLRALIWDDLVACLKEEGEETSVLAALERLRVA
jgi:hypothetical protein